MNVSFHTLAANSVGQLHAFDESSARETVRSGRSSLPVTTWRQTPRDPQHLSSSVFGCGSFGYRLAESSVDVRRQRSRISPNGVSMRCRLVLTRSVARRRRCVRVCGGEHRRRAPPVCGGGLGADVQPTSQSGRSGSSVDGSALTPSDPRSRNAIDDHRVTAAPMHAECRGSSIRVSVERDV